MTSGSRNARSPRVIAAFVVAITGCDQSQQPDPAVNSVGASAAPPWFEEAASARGLVFSHVSGHTGKCLFPEITTGGAALFDMDNDGDLDAYLVQGGAMNGDVDQMSNRLFRNDGQGNFEDVTQGSGADDRGYGMGVATGDFDNDGDTDLYVTNLGRNTLLANDGGGRFEDVTETAGVGHERWSSSAAFVDYDADGDLDLFVTNYIYWSINAERDCYTPAGIPDYCQPNSYEAPAQDILYRNDGDGAFTDVSGPSGIGNGFGNGLGVVCGDFNADGFIDIYVANDGKPNQLWLNQGNGTFKDEAMLSGCATDQDGIEKAGMGVAAIDIDDDLDLDLLVVNLTNEADSFYRNQGEYFKDDTALIGLGVASRGFTRFGTAFADFNNDGRLDLYEANGRVQQHTSAAGGDPFAEANLLFSLTPNGRFEEVRPRGGTKNLLVATSRAAAFGDIDNDGGVDVLIVNRDADAHLLRNVVQNRGHWIAFRVVNRHGADALGATVTMNVGDRTVSRDVRTAYSYLAANDPRIHVGLGDAGEVTDVTVRWPDGQIQQFGAHEADQIVELRRSTDD